MNKKDGMLSDVPKPRLADLILEANRKWTFREMARRSGVLREGYISQLSRGRDPNLTRDTMLALAKSLGCHPVLIFEACVGAPLTKGIRDETLQQLFADLASLPAKDREELNFPIRQLRREVDERISKQKP